MGGHRLGLGWRGAGGCAISHIHRRGKRPYLDIHGAVPCLPAWRYCGIGAEAAAGREGFLGADPRPWRPVRPLRRGAGRGDLHDGGGAGGGRAGGAPVSAGRRRRVTILGATGSIGESTIDLIARDRGRFEVVALTGGRNVARLAEQAITLEARHAVTCYPECYQELAGLLSGSGVTVAAGPEAVAEAACLPADWIMS